MNFIKNESANVFIILFICLLVVAFVGSLYYLMSSPAKDTVQDIQNKLNTHSQTPTSILTQIPTPIPTFNTTITPTNTSTPNPTPK